MRSRTRAAILGAALMALLVVAAPAAAEPTWAPAGEADIRPGSMTFTEGGQCTSNFVFFDAEDNVYIGQAAHCAGTGGATATNGCDTESLPLGTEVEIEGAEQPGTLAYSSWLAMQEVDETDPNACMFNDFALVKLDPADVASTNPSVPFFGGPTGIDTDGTEMGESVYSYGSSELLLGQFSPKTGESLGTTGEGWTHPVLTFPPGVPGDSGSAYLTDGGSALGVLSTVTILGPAPGSNGVSDLNLALDYANAHGGLGTLELVPGTEPFDAGGSAGGLGSLGGGLGGLGGLGTLLPS